MNRISGILNALLDIALPPRCHICHKTVPGEVPLHICTECYKLLPIISSPVCSVCGIPFEGKGEDHICSRCITSPPPYNAARAALKYDGSCKELIHAYKYLYKSHLRRPLSLLTADILRSFAVEQNPELLIPVPLHKSRLRSRGFNQSLLIAETLSKNWQIPLLRQGLIRTRRTTPQVELTRAERLTNLKGAFTVKETETVADKHIMLVDDVFTTGATLSACAETLLKAGCSRVSAVTVAHATS